MSEESSALLAAFSTHLLAAGRGVGTVRLRVGYLRVLAADHPDLLAVEFQDLEQYLADRRSTHKAETRKSMRASFRVFYAWAYSEGLIPADPSFKLAPVRVPQTIPRMAPDDVVLAAVDRAKPIERAIVLLGRLGCLRRAEIATLHMRDRDGSHLRVTGKGEKQRRVPCPPELLTALHELEQTQPFGFYFPGTGADGHIHVDTVHRVITDLTGWNPHSLRHAGATAAFRTTRNLRAVQELLGHSTIATTERYVHVDEDELWAAAMGTGFRPPIDPVSPPEAA